jgi:hypothetical protein
VRLDRRPQPILPIAITLAIAREAQRHHNVMPELQLDVRTCFQKEVGNIRMGGQVCLDLVPLWHVVRPIQVIDLGCNRGLCHALSSTLSNH